MIEQIEALVIPDKKRPKKRKLWLYLLVLIIFNSVLGLLVANSIDEAHITWVYTTVVLMVFSLSVLISLSAAIILSTTIHELGHLLFAKMFEYPVYAIQICQLRITKTKKSFKFRYDPGNWGGHIVCFVDAEKTSKSKRVWFYLGGGLANLLTAGLALLLWSQADFQFHFLPLGLANPPFFAFILYSILAGLITFLPLQFGGFSSDGAKILSLFKDSEMSEHEFAIDQIGRASFDGVRPRDWSKEWCDALNLSTTEGYGQPISHYFMYLRRYDQGDFLAARDHLQAALDQIDPKDRAIQPILFSEAISFEALIRGDNESALRWGDQFPQRYIILDPLTKLRSDAILAYARKEYVLAREIINQAREAVDVTLEEGVKALELGNLEILEQKMTEVLPLVSA